MTATKSNVGHTANLLLWLAAGTAIGILFAALGGHTFQRHVRVFYPDGAPHSELMRMIAGIAIAFRPIAWFAALLGPAYYCLKQNLAQQYIWGCGVCGAVMGYAGSGYVHANPGPNYDTSEINVPIGVFVGSFVGIVIQAIRGWDRVPPRRPESRSDER